MKPLIAIACAAIISASGYYFWSEYQNHLVAADQQDAIDSAKAELFNMAGAQPSDWRKVTRFCAGLEDRDDSNDADMKRLVRQLSINCRAFGYM